MEEKIERTRCRRKQRKTWTSDVTDWCGMSYTECVRVAESRGNGDLCSSQPSAKKMAHIMSVKALRVLEIEHYIKCSLLFLLLILSP